MGFVKAERSRAKMRLAVEGPSGSGKTYSALLIAMGLAGPNGKIAVVDTENRSASLYSNLCKFDVADLEKPFSPDRYIQIINQAKDYDVLVIDSITHEWNGPGGCLEMHSEMPGNSYTNWAKITPKHRAFMDALITFPKHLIVTMRSSEAYVLVENDRGKQEPKKVGMEAEQRKGVAYEFTTVLTMDISHKAMSTKDRTGLFKVDNWFVPTVQTGEALLAWLESGVDVPEPPKQAKPATSLREEPAFALDWSAVKELTESLGWTKQEVAKFCNMKLGNPIAKLNQEQIGELTGLLQKELDARAEQEVA